MTSQLNTMTEHEQAIEDLKVAIRSAFDEIKNVQILTDVIKNEIEDIKQEIQINAIAEIRKIMLASGITDAQISEVGKVRKEQDKPISRSHCVFELDGITYGIYRGKGKATGKLAEAIAAGQKLEDMKAAGKDLPQNVKSVLEANVKEIVDITDMLK